MLLCLHFKLNIVLFTQLHVHIKIQPQRTKILEGEQDDIFIIKTTITMISLNISMLHIPHFPLLLIVHCVFFLQVGGRGHFVPVSRERLSGSEASKV